MESKEIIKGKKKTRPQGKYELELNMVGNRTYLNFWDWMHGKDVVAQVHQDGLWVRGKKVSINEYLRMVKKAIKNRKPIGEIRL